MRSYTLGREAILLNQGINFLWQNPHDMIVRGFLASISLKFSADPPPAGFSQTFLNLWGDVTLAIAFWARRRYQ